MTKVKICHHSVILQNAPFFYTKKNSQDKPDIYLEIDDTETGQKNDAGSNKASFITAGIVVGAMFIVAIVSGTVFIFKKKTSTGTSHSNTQI